MIGASSPHRDVPIDGPEAQLTPVRPEHGPYLTRLLKASKVPYRKTGNRHRVPAVALREFKAHRDRQLDQLDRLVGDQRF